MINIRAKLVSAFLLVRLGSAHAQWTNWPQSIGGNGHWYRPARVGATISWLTASNLAKIDGGYLATITSEEENNFVFNLINKPVYWNGELGPLFGGYQRLNSPEPAGGWVWVSGEPWAYTHWAGAQPDNAAPGEDAIHFWSGPFWNDIRKDGSAFLSYVVERGKSPTDVEIAVTEVGISWLALSNETYRVFYRSTLTTNFWEPLTANTFVGADEKITVYDSVVPGSAQRFCRVEKVE
jgi:hypothetical protein